MTLFYKMGEGSLERKVGRENRRGARAVWERVIWEMKTWKSFLPNGPTSVCVPLQRLGVIPGRCIL